MKEEHKQKVKYKETAKFQILCRVRSHGLFSMAFLIILFYDFPHRTKPVCKTNSVVMEDNVIPNGWPLGLGNTNSTIRVAYTSLMAPPPPPLSCASVVQYRSSGFSSLSSSNLDTESTTSFFPDQSVSLGWLFGIRDKGGNEQRCFVNIPNVVKGSDLGTHNGHENSQGLCVPLLHLVGRLSRRRSTFGN